MLSPHSLSRRTALCVVLFSMLPLNVGSRLQSQAPPPTPTGTAVIVFGVGTPALTAARAGTSIGIVTAGRLYVFDAGPGVERRIMEATPTMTARSVRSFGPVFITHLDMDHTVGLAALHAYHEMQPRTTVGRTGPETQSGLRLGGGELTVYGPGSTKGTIGIADVIDHITAAFANPPVFAPNIRVNELTLGARSVKAITIQPGVIYRDDAVTVTAFEVAHKPPLG